MAIFGLGTVFTSLNPSDFVSTGDEDTNKVVAQWAGGELRKDDLYLLRQKHFAAQRLLQNVYQFAVKENGGKSFPIAVPQILPLARPGTDPTVEQMDEQMMNRFLFAKRAQEEGFIVDEKMALDYVLQFGGDVPMSKNMLKQLNRQVNQQIPLTAVVRHIQTELLAQQMESFARGGLPFDDFNPVSAAAINPTEAIQLYARSNKQIECQVLPISVEEYVSKVNEEPSDSELKKLYEEGKYDYPYINFEKPGFKKWKQAKVQYFVGELETFLKNEIAKLTDAEVQAEYDRLVEANDDFVMEVVQKDDESNPGDGDTDNQQEGLDLEDPAPAPGDDSDSESSSDSDSEEGSGDNDSSEPVEMPDSDGEKTNTSLKNTKQDEEPESEEQEGTENDVPENDLRNDSDDDNSNQSEDTQQPSDESNENESADTGDEDSSASESSEADQEAAGNEDEKSSESNEQEPGTDPVIEDKPKVERRPKPLVDIAEELKRRMKMQDARTALDEALDAAEKSIRKFQMKRSKWEYEQERNGDDESKELTPPDFNKTADEFQLQFMETDLVNQITIKEERIGQITTFSFANQRLVQNDVGEQIFNQYEDLPLYQPTMVDDGANRAKVIYWLVEKVDQNIPDFKTARPAVVKYWKRQQGLKAAETEAQNVVTRLKDTGKMLKDLYPEKAQDTGAFSWFSSFGRFAYGQPAAVEEPGEDFMAEAFSLREPKDAGFALNGNRDIVYVIQNNSSYEKSLEQLGKEYMDQNFFQSKRIPQEVVSAKGMYRRRLNFEWLRELQDKMKVDVVGQ